MANWYKFPTTLRISDREYQSNISGMNIVFGAVLGFVLAGAEGLPAGDFMTVLAVSALAVILILYLGTTEYKLFYGVLTAAVVLAMPEILIDQLSINPIPYLQPTLIVWAAMVTVLELTPREQPATIKTPTIETEEPSQ